MAVLRKPDDERRAELCAKKSKGAKAKSIPVPRGVDAWLENPKHYALSVANDEVIAIPADIAPLMPLFADLRVLQAGVTVGTVKGKNCVPSHALALSTAISSKAFSQSEVDYATAMAYMRGEAIVLPDAPRGYVLLTYRGKPIGFANNLGNRANNLYPKPWRVLSTHIPTTPPEIL